jgi:glucose 1-dehydrogenase
MQKLKGQSALITGANSGIGEAVAIEMAKEGASVAINYVTNEINTEKI